MNDQTLFDGVEAVFPVESHTADIARRRAEYDAQAGLFPFLGRALADSRDRVGWAKARSRAIGASDAAGFAKLESAPLYLRSKLYSPFMGNAYTQHGNEREPHMLAAYHVEQNFTLFASAGNRRHVATPDGIKLGLDGDFFLVQCKTSVKPLWKIPPAYLRQCWWEMYVCGADRTLFVWETHTGGQPDQMEPDSQWVYRDDAEIQKLVTIADLVLAGMDEAEQFEKEMQ